jgi:hypothetical protein
MSALVNVSVDVIPCIIQHALRDGWCVHARALRLVCRRWNDIVEEVFWPIFRAQLMMRSTVRPALHPSTTIDCDIDPPMAERLMMPTHHSYPIRITHPRIYLHISTSCAHGQRGLHMDIRGFSGEWFVPSECPDAWQDISADQREGLVERCEGVLERLFPSLRGRFAGLFR